MISACFSHIKHRFSEFCFFSLFLHFSMLFHAFPATSHLVSHFIPRFTPHFPTSHLTVLESHLTLPHSCLPSLTACCHHSLTTIVLSHCLDFTPCMLLFFVYSFNVWVYPELIVEFSHILSLFCNYFTFYSVFHLFYFDFLHLFHILLSLWVLRIILQFFASSDASALHLHFICTSLHYIGIHLKTFAYIKYTMKTFTYTVICTSLLLLHNTLAASEYCCPYIYSRAVFKQFNLFCLVNVASEIGCANNLIYFHNLFHSVYLSSMFVMLSPASIIYADLSKLAEVMIYFSVIVLYVSEW